MSVISKYIFSLPISKCCLANIMLLPCSEEKLSYSFDRVKLEYTPTSAHKYPFLAWYQLHPSVDNKREESDLVPVHCLP